MHKAQLIIDPPISLIYLNLINILVFKNIISELNRKMNTFKNKACYLKLKKSDLKSKTNSINLSLSKPFPISFFLS